MYALTGWTYAILSILCFGSFGVPIKSRVTVLLDIDPLVFQTYKTLACLFTSPIVLLVPGTDFSFTPWGIVSGIFWVPAGVAAIVAVRLAGLAVGQGVWSSLIVLVSFIWGVGVFGEKVRTVFGATAAAIMMVMGLLGMSYYSLPVSSEIPIDSRYNTLEIEMRESTSDSEDEIFTDDEEDDVEGNFEDDVEEEGRSCGDEDEISVALKLYKKSSVDELDISIDTINVFKLYGRNIPSHYIGLAAAIFNGVWGGSILVPLHYSSDQTKGLQYVISFSIGSACVTFALWILRYAYHLLKEKSFVAAFRKLPPFHLRQMLLPGGLAGVLWSMGNIFSIMTVMDLGEGVGYSVIQSSMIVSGLWGIFWYKEIQARGRIMKWFLSASLTIFGLVMLSNEHIS